MDREDFIEFDELEKTIDIDNIPYEKLMRVFIGFLCDELITKENINKLNIDLNNEIMIIGFARQGEAFLEERITREELLKERVSAWTTYYGLSDGSTAQKLLRIVVCCLYDRKAAEFDRYGSDSKLDLYFTLLQELGPGYCKMFRCYIQNNLVL